MILLVVMVINGVMKVMRAGERSVKWREGEGERKVLRWLED